MTTKRLKITYKLNTALTLPMVAAHLQAIAVMVTTVTAKMKPQVLITPKAGATRQANVVVYGHFLQVSAGIMK